MDVARLQKAQELLEKSKATELIMNIVKNCQKENLDISSTQVPEFTNALFMIKQDFYRKLVELKSEYDKEFSII
jgi:hypothetical protein